MKIKSSLEIVSEETFKKFTNSRWFITFPGFFKNTTRFIIDGHVVGFKDSETKEYRLDYSIINQYNL